MHFWSVEGVHFSTIINADNKPEVSEESPWARVGRSHWARHAPRVPSCCQPDKWHWDKLSLTISHYWAAWVNNQTGDNWLSVHLASVQAPVAEAEGGDDVSEGGGDVAPTPRPPDRRDTGVGVDLENKWW